MNRKIIALVLAAAAALALGDVRLEPPDAAACEAQRDITLRRGTPREITIRRDACAMTGPGHITIGQNNEDAVIFRRYFANSEFERGGTFLELGALDGRVFSNSVAFETCYGWRGVLLDAERANYEKLTTSRPCATRAWVAPSCDCGLADGCVAKIAGAAGTAHELVAGNEGGGGSVAEVPCARLGDVLRAAGVNRINFFSLDVEGAELKVLETLDSHPDLRIDVLMVEAAFIQQTKAKANNPKIDAVRAWAARRGLVRVRSRLDNTESGAPHHPLGGRPMRGRVNLRGVDYSRYHLSIAGSDLFVSKELAAAEWEALAATKTPGDSAPLP